MSSPQPKTSCLLGLPEEILLQVFGQFAQTNAVRNRTFDWLCSSGPNSLEPPELLTLQRGRLVCRALNSLISPLLCPVVRISLDEQSLNRLENICRNPLIAQGIRGLDLNLRYRSRLLASDMGYYCQRMSPMIEEVVLNCDQQQQYDDSDETEEAVEYRMYKAAEEKLWLIRQSWSECVQVPNGLKRSEATEMMKKRAACSNDVHQVMLQECFDSYVAQHEEQMRIVSKGTFVQALVAALSRCERPLFIWFTDEDPVWYQDRDDALKLANDPDLLPRCMKEAHGWLLTKMLNGEKHPSNLLDPPRLLTEIPIACHRAGVRLRGFSVGCFPPPDGFESIMPPDLHSDDEPAGDFWVRFSAACYDIEVFHFGMQGMHCTSSLSFPFSKLQSSILDAYIGAACHGWNLQVFGLSMTPFRLNPRYSANAIISCLQTTRIYDCHIKDVDLDGASLASLTANLSRLALRNVYFDGIVLSRGTYAEAMRILHDIMVGSECGKAKPRIRFFSLQGAEFGPLRGRNEPFMYVGSAKVWDAYVARVGNYINPGLQQRVQKWINEGRAGEQDPLVSLE